MLHTMSTSTIILVFIYNYKFLFIIVLVGLCIYRLIQSWSEGVFRACNNKCPSMSFPIELMILVYILLPDFYKLVFLSVTSPCLPFSCTSRQSSEMSCLATIAPEPRIFQPWKALARGVARRSGGHGRKRISTYDKHPTPWKKETLLASLSSHGIIISYDGHL